MSAGGPNGALHGAARRYRFLGIALESDFPFEAPLPEDASRAAGVDEQAALHFSCVDRAPVGGLPEGAAPAFESRHPRRLDRAGMQLFRLVGGIDLLRFADIADHWVERDRLRCRPARPELATLVEIQLLGQVVSYWLERRGTPVLHAAVVEIGGRAIALLGAGGSGKSSLACKLIEGGGRLLSDDLLPICPLADGTGFAALPAMPQMRLWPDRLERLGDRLLGGGDDRSSGSDRAAALPPVHPSFDKRLLALPSSAFCPHPVPLAAIYLPHRYRDRVASSGRSGHDAIASERLSPAEALVELARGSFLAELVEAIGWQERRMAALAALSASVPVRRLRYPNGEAELVRVRDRIIAELAPRDRRRPFV